MAAELPFSSRIVHSPALPKQTQPEVFGEEEEGGEWRDDEVAEEEEEHEMNDDEMNVVQLIRMIKFYCFCMHACAANHL